MNAQDVAAWLSTHPDFFLDYPGLLETLRVPHPQGEHTISIVERQLIALRERNARLERQLAELIGYGHQNDQLIDKMHRLALALLRAPDAAVSLAVAHESLRSDFAIPYSAIRWWGDPLPGVDASVSEASAAMRSYIAGLDQPYVGPNAAHDSRTWLVDMREPAQSFAYVPLGDVAGGAPCGALMLASPDPERFTPDMAVDVLARLGHLITASLARYAERDEREEVGG
ncbi:MAG: DUF484 family protein [Casimicrobiaceae bacterium]|nr:DUF484 family protein [Casimicrobiaceae bacterium]MCX8098319.1 DUF484 family protein [Casimicrobiaceae bacterium]MDW8311745.1 DUF484 family protein [Burkholderiales bacterium]